MFFSFWERDFEVGLQDAAVKAEVANRGTCKCGHYIGREEDALMKVQPMQISEGIRAQKMDNRSQVGGV